MGTTAPKGGRRRWPWWPAVFIFDRCMVCSIMVIKSSFPTKALSKVCTNTDGFPFHGKKAGLFLSRHSLYIFEFIYFYADLILKRFTAAHFFVNFQTSIIFWGLLFKTLHVQHTDIGVRSLPLAQHDWLTVAARSLLSVSKDVFSLFFLFSLSCAYETEREREREGNPFLFSSFLPCPSPGQNNLARKRTSKRWFALQ